MKIKHLIFPIVALLTFVVGVFAVDLSPPIPATNVAQTNKSDCSVMKINLDSFQEIFISSKYEPKNLNRKAEIITTNNFYPNFSINNHQAKIAKNIYDLPPDEYRQKLGFDGNKANQIRADTKKF